MSETHDARPDCDGLTVEQVDRIHTDLCNRIIQGMNELLDAGFDARFVGTAGLRASTSFMVFAMSGAYERPIGPEAQKTITDYVAGLLKTAAERAVVLRLHRVGTNGEVPN